MFANQHVNYTNANNQMEMFGFLVIKTRNEFLLHYKNKFLIIMWI